MGKGRDARLRAVAAADDSENVVPFVRPHRETGNEAAPPIILKSADRPAPGAASPMDKPVLFALLIGSLALHSSLLALFRQEPEPYSSVGIPAISVEIVLGADAPAGVTQTPSPNETQETASIGEQIDPVEMTPPVAEPEAPARRTESEPLSDETSDSETESVPIQVEPEAPAAEAMTPPIPVQPKPKPKQEPKEAKRQVEKAKQPPPAASRSAPAASGVGRGRSGADANYHGLVAAHLARHKQYPAEARTRREEGTASITFAIDGSGRMTSVRLARSSGAPALDEESVAMVRRASPFPAPPDGRPMSFTVPVSFHIR